MRWLLTGIALIAATPAEPTLAQRKRFAEKHQQKLVFESGGDCVKVTAPSALHCATPVWVCPRGWSSAMCTGSYSNDEGVTFQMEEPKEEDVESTPLPMLILESEAGEDCPECECAYDEGLGFGAGMSEAEKERARRRFAKESAQRHAQCVREAAARQKAERTKIKCTMLMVDPCRQEAFIRCTGKNGPMPLGKTLQYSFAPQLDGGAPLGGEWEEAETPEE